MDKGFSSVIGDLLAMERRVVGVRNVLDREGLLCRLQSLINPKSITMLPTAVGQFGCERDAVGRGCCVSRMGLLSRSDSGMFRYPGNGSSVVVV